MVLTPHITRASTYSKRGTSLLRPHRFLVLQSDDLGKLSLQLVGIRVGFLQSLAQGWDFRSCVPGLGKLRDESSGWAAAGIRGGSSVRDYRPGN